ncbi:MAG: hypothetical protein R3F43_07075 [bacterium]
MDTAPGPGRPRRRSPDGRAGRRVAGLPGRARAGAPAGGLGSRRRPGALPRRAGRHRRGVPLGGRPGGPGAGPLLRVFTPAEAGDGGVGLHRFQRGHRGGPDAVRCVDCHWKGGFAGAGDRADNSQLFGDGDHVRGQDPATRRRCGAWKSSSSAARCRPSCRPPATPRWPRRGPGASPWWWA